jgi:stage V sporulation protein AB
LGAFLYGAKPELFGLWQGVGVFLQLMYGLFGGMFIGCLALSIAEMLDSIPIFARRISFRHGIGLVVLSVALGKLGGSLYYFWVELHLVME